MLYRLRQLHNQFVKIRMNNLPVKAAKSEGVSAIGLNSDEGIGEETAFLYSPTHKVLLLQQNQAGVSVTRVSEYFNHFGNGEDIVGISVMMKLDAFERFKKAQRIQSVSIGLVSVAGVEDYRDSGMSVSHAIDAMNQLGGQRINITVSVRQKDKSLSKGPVGKMISSLFGKHESDAARVTKLQLRADDEDGASMINFLRDRLVKAFNVPEDEDRRLSYKTRLDLIWRAWNSTDFQKLLEAMQ